MQGLSLRNKIIAFVVTLGLILVAVFKFGLGGMSTPIVNNDSKPAEQNSSNPALISSDPPELYIKKPLIISPSQVLKLNFSVPLQNGPETKIVVDPPADVQIELTNDNKTAV